MRTWLTVVATAVLTAGAMRVLETTAAEAHDADLVVRGLTLVDGSGERRGRWYVEPDGTVQFAVRAEEGKAGAALTVDASGESIRFAMFAPDGKGIWVEPHGIVVFQDRATRTVELDAGGLSVAYPLPASLPFSDRVAIQAVTSNQDRGFAVLSIGSTETAPVFIDGFIATARPASTDK